MSDSAYLYQSMSLSPSSQAVPSSSSHSLLMFPSSSLPFLNIPPSYEMKNQQMSLFQFYSYIDGSLHVSGVQAHLQESSHSCLQQPLFQCLYRSGRVLCMLLYRARNLNSTDTEPMVIVNSCVNSPEDGPVCPKHVEIRRYMNKIEIVTSISFSFHMLKRCTVQKA